MQSTFRKAVCSLITFAFTFTSTAGNYALAQGAAERAAQSSATAGAVGTTTGIEDLGKTGNAFGKELGGKIKAGGGPTFDGTNINYQAGGKTYSISKDKLAPSDNGKNIRYAHTAEDFEKQKDLYNDGGQMDETGNQQKDELFADAESPNPTLEGEVYALLVDMAKKDKPDYTGEAFWEKTTEIMGDMENVLQDLVSCDANSALDSQYEYKHIPDIKVCQQVVDRSMTCTIEHDYTAGIIVHRDGPFNIDSCGEGCTTVWLGNPDDQNYYAGEHDCQLYEYQIKIGILNPGAITRVELTDIYWDDQMQVYFGKDGREVKLLQLPYPETFVPKFDEQPNVRPMFTFDGPYSGAAHDSCQQVISWHWQTSLDLTSLFKGADPTTNYTFRIRVAVQDKGEGYARLKVHYDPNKVVSNDLWKPKDCVDAASAIDDGFATGDRKCSSMPEVDSSGCTWINGAQVCSNKLSPSPIGGISNLCRRVEVKTNYDFYKGDTGCWKAMVGFDENGNIIYEEVCGGQNLGGNLDTCNQYKDDPNCKFIESKCTPDMTGASGTCYVNDVTYDCGKDVKVNQVEADTKYDCNGIACLGENCIDVERTYSTDFAKINALLNAAQYMAEDMECTGLDEEGKPIGDQNVTCMVFGGTSGYCKIAVGGWQDCCEPIGGPGVAEYISMIMSAQKGHSSIISMSQQIMTPEIAANGDLTLAQEMAGQYAEAWGAVKDVMATGLDYLARAFGSSADNIYTFTNYLAAPFDWVKKMIIQKLQDWVQQQLTKILAKVGINIGETTGTAATETPMYETAMKQVFGNQVGGMMASAIQVVGWVYLAYQVANLIIQIVYKCGQEEYEMLSKKEAKNCHYVGSYCKDKKLGICIVKHRVYCCFQSPLSRIINEQVKATQGSLLGDQGDWGDPKHPKCNGIPLEKIGEIDWDKINLDEWTALLLSTNNMVTADNVDLERLTGATSRLNWTGSQGILTNLPSSDGSVEVTDKNTENTLQKDPAADAGTATASTFSMMRSRAAVAAADADSGKKPNDRRNTIERTEMKLNNLDVDGLRIESARCMSLELGNGVTVRGGCGEATNAELYCRKNGALIDCEDVAYQNSLGELLGNKPSSQDYWDDGYRCVKNDANIDCSTLYSKEAYIKALEEYAKIIGGTTYLNRYVCLDKSGTFTQAICEHAMEQNYCSCLPGQFICQDGNKEISCAALGATKNDCSCMIGACTEDCQYGGYPKDMADNEALVCSYINSPYGHTVNGTVDKPEILCPYGH